MSQTYSYSFIFFHPNRELKNQSISIVVALLPGLERNAIFRRICEKNKYVTQSHCCLQSLV